MSGHPPTGDWENSYTALNPQTEVVPRRRACFDFIQRQAGFTESVQSLRNRIYGLHYWDEGAYDLEILDARMDYAWEVDGVRFRVFSYVRFRIWDRVYEASGPVFERFREIGKVGEDG